MQSEDDFLVKAAANISFTPIFEFKGVEIHVVCLLSWSPPMIAHWYNGKEASILAVDVNGNFFLRHCSGVVLYRNHSEEKTIEVSSSVREFVSKLREDIDGTLE